MSYQMPARPLVLSERGYTIQQVNPLEIVELKEVFRHISPSYHTSLSENTLILVAKSKEGRIIGGIDVSIEPEKRTAHINGVATLPEFRTRGIGANLVETMEKVVMERGIKVMHVDAVNEGSEHLFKKLGYTTISSGLPQFREGSKPFILLKLGKNL